MTSEPDGKDGVGARVCEAPGSAPGVVSADVVLETRRAIVGRVRPSPPTLVDAVRRSGDGDAFVRGRRSG